MTFVTALILGLIASAHCAAMCSGLQQAFQASHVIHSKHRLFWHNLALNFGRLSGYTIVGAALAWGSVGLFELVGAQAYIAYLRIAMAVVLFVIGVQMMFRRVALLTPLEPAGRWLWLRVKKWHCANHQNDLRRSYVNGVILSMLPCGLLYSVYLTAALSGNAVQGGAIMLGFGLGTLPSLLLSGSAWILFKRWVSQTQLQIAGGLFYCLGALMVFFAPAIIDMSFAQTYPGLVNTVFCLR